MEEDIKILEDLKNKINFNHNESKYENSTYRNALQNLLTRYKQLEEENENLKNDLQHDGLAHKYLTLKATSIPVSKVKEILNKEKLPLTIVGGRRNAKTLEYGRKLGRIEVCKELLREE